MVSTEMLASDLPESNKKRSVMAKSKKGGKFKEAFMKRFGKKGDDEEEDPKKGKKPYKK